MAFGISIPSGAACREGLGLDSQGKWVAGNEPLPCNYCQKRPKALWCHVRAKALLGSSFLGGTETLYSTVHVQPRKQLQRSTIIMETSRKTFSELARL